MHAALITKIAKFLDLLWNIFMWHHSVYKQFNFQFNERSLVIFAYWSVLSHNSSCLLSIVFDQSSWRFNQLAPLFLSICTRDIMISCIDDGFEYSSWIFWGVFSSFFISTVIQPFSCFELISKTHICRSFDDEPHQQSFWRSLKIDRNHHSYYKIFQFPLELVVEANRCNKLKSIFTSMCVAEI